MKQKQYLIFYKLFFAVLGIAAVITEVVVLSGRGTFVASNFFSFFTVISNIFAAIMLTSSALYMISGRAVSYTLNFLRGASTLYMVMTGAIFAVLLSSIDPRLLTAVPWDNTVLHYIIPVVVLLDWLIDRPSPKVRLNHAALWLIVPLAYVAYTLVRGPIVGWYPYPFLNPGLGGYDYIFIICVCITIFALIVTKLLVSSQSFSLNSARKRRS